MTATEVSRFADGSTLPDYRDAGGLHRDGERRVVFTEQSTVEVCALPDVELTGSVATYRGRVHVTATNDAEALADIWGTLVDREPLSQALVARFVEFVQTNFGDDIVRSLTARSAARDFGREPRNTEVEDTASHRYAFGHTGV